MQNFFSNSIQNIIFTNELDVSDSEFDEIEVALEIGRIYYNKSFLTVGYSYVVFVYYSNMTIWLYNSYILRYGCVKKVKSIFHNKISQTIFGV